MYNGFGFFLNRKPVAPTDGLFYFLAMQQPIYMLEDFSDVPIIHIGRGLDRYLTVEECDEIIARAKIAKKFARQNDVHALNVDIWRQSEASSRSPRERKKPSPTNIYLMVDKNTGLHKIGRSKTPVTRERTLQSEKPTIEIIFHTAGTVKDEKHLHEKFNAKRVRGEWFNLSEEDIDFIKTNYNPLT